MTIPDLLRRYVQSGLPILFCVLRVGQRFARQDCCTLAARVCPCAEKATEEASVVRRYVSGMVRA